MGQDRSDDYFSCLQGILKEIHKWGWLCPSKPPWCMQGDPEEVIGKQSSQGAKGWDERRGKGLQCHWQLLWERPPCSQAVLEHQNGKGVTPAWLWPWSTAETGWCSRLVKISHSSKGQRWRGPMSFLWCQELIMEFPWNIDYSGKKRKREEERKRNLRDYLLRWEWLRSLELAQLSVLLSEEMGSWEVKFNFSRRQRKFYPLTSGLCTEEKIFSLYLFWLLLI